MQSDHPLLVRVRKRMDDGLVTVELVGLAITGIATTVAIWQEVMVMVNAGIVRLADLLLMFLYLEVLAMIGQYLRTGQIQVRFPIYIAMVALARYLIIETKEIDTWRIVAVAAAILLLTLSVLVVRYGHRRFPYDEDERREVQPKKSGSDHDAPADRQERGTPAQAVPVDVDPGRGSAIGHPRGGDDGS